MGCLLWIHTDLYSASLTAVMYAVSCYIGPSYHDITQDTAMTETKCKSDFKFTTYTPYLILMGDLWGVCCEDLGENGQHYTCILYYHNSTILYLLLFPELCGSASLHPDICDTQIGQWEVRGTRQTTRISRSGLIQLITGITTVLHKAGNVWYCPEEFHLCILIKLA